MSFINCFIRPKTFKNITNIYKERKERPFFVGYWKPYKREPRPTRTIPVFRGPRHIILKFIEKKIRQCLKECCWNVTKKKEKRKKNFLQIKNSLHFNNKIASYDLWIEIFIKNFLSRKAKAFCVSDLLWWRVKYFYPTVGKSPYKRIRVKETKYILSSLPKKMYFNNADTVTFLL